MTETAVRTTEPPAEQIAAPEPPRVNRLRALDGLRLVAALMVALYHYAGRGAQVSTSWGASPKTEFPTLHQFATYGCLGVQVFFVISGFVICMSGWGRSLQSFFASRVSRLMPAYWFAVALLVVVMALPAVPFKGVSPSDALINFTLLQQPIGAERVLGVCWTLWVEIRFYALFALLVVIPGADRRRVLMFSIGWLFAIPIAQASHLPFLDLVVMPEYAPYFIGGMGLYLVHRDRRDIYAWGLAAAGFLIGQHYAVKDLWNASDPNAFAHRTTFGIVAIVAFGFIAVAAIALGWLNWANWKWLTVAGALTYPFYLLHEHLGWVIIWALHRKLDIPAIPTFFLTVGGMLVLAYLIYRFIEKPFTPKLRTALLKAR
ncbi:acyltransferase [Streptomyces niveiscabiei]|uniref:acyltransferase family protein n=1 Tax=Streptomyces niveiscabiei TaxID=164115 RepID=UPI0029A78704|nr:acyltransferase [Streptomyces niveiscabiei]MDX3387265.1 acyltransferase [Streptomyces niveiscabiei]